ncbi:MAG: hypothetical protein ACJ72D_16545 [Marmoricola sp.]
MHISPSTRVRSVTVLLAGAAALSLGLVVVLLVATPAPRAVALGWSPLVDAPSQYDAQTVCTKAAGPGTVALARYLQRTYPVTGSMGMMRACGSGGTSEHKDGRAFDWAADVSRRRTKRAAYDFLRRALATDAAGNPHALARRMGIMYLIYNDTIWSSYRDFVPRPYLNSGCRTRARCSRTLRHLNHVHISLGLAGAAAQTSWYRARNVAAQPVLYPGTNQLDPDNTAVTGFTVPATGAVTSSPFTLRAGVTYRIVATGTVTYGPGATGDASCTAAETGWVPTDRTAPTLRVAARGYSGWGGWEHQAGSSHDASPLALALPTTHGLAVAGGLRWEGGCSPDHTYEAWYTPLLTQRLEVGYVDLGPGDNTGAFTVYVARDDISKASLAR